MTEWSRIVRPSLIGLEPYRPGASLEELKEAYGLDEIVKLNWNEGLEGPFPGVEEAVAAGLHVDEKVYKRLAGVPLGEPVPEESALGTLHTNGGPWLLLGGWKQRVVEPGDLVHPSVRHRIEATAGTEAPYRPKLPG